METENPQTNPEHSKQWYDNKFLLIILIFLFPPLGIYGMLKRKTATWKKVLYIIPSAFMVLYIPALIYTSFFIDNYKEGIDSYNRKDYAMANYYYKMVKPDDKNYNNAVVKLSELKPKMDSVKADKSKKEEILGKNDKTGNKPLNVDVDKLKNFQKKWTDSIVKVENTAINGFHLVGSKTSLPDTILLEYSKNATKEGYDINLEKDTEMYRQFYRDAISKTLGKDYSSYPVYISPIPNKSIVAQINPNIEFDHPALAFRGIAIYKGNSVYKEKIGYVECVFDDPDRDKYDMYNEIVIIQGKNGIIKIPHSTLKKNYWTTKKENDLSQTVKKCN